MLYREARPAIKSGDLLAWSHRGWRSWYDIKIQLVRFFTQSEFSHVGVAWVVGGRVLVIEAVVPKVRIYPLSKLGTFYLIPGFIDWTPETEEDALSFIGTDYSQLEALAAFFNTSVDLQSMQCAKLVSRIRTKNLANPTPSEVVNVALSEGLVLHKIDELK
jgi:hypothetical protein